MTTRMTQKELNTLKQFSLKELMILILKRITHEAKKEGSTTDLKDLKQKLEETLKDYSGLMIHIGYDTIPEPVSRFHMWVENYYKETHTVIDSVYLEWASSKFKELINESHLLSETKRDILSHAKTDLLRIEKVDEIQLQLEESTDTRVIHTLIPGI